MVNRIPKEVDGLIGLRMRSRRRELRLSQQRLATLIGASVEQVEKYETGRTSLNVARLIEIAGVLQAPLEFFLRDIGENWPLTGKPANGFEAHVARDARELVRAFVGIPQESGRLRLLSLARELAKDRQLSEKLN